MNIYRNTTRSRFGGWTTETQLPNRERVAGTNAAEHTYAYLKELIVTLDLPPRSIVTENEVATAAGVSRTPVREAFFRLESESLLEILPRRGAMIPDITLRHIREQAETRVVLEGYGAEWICDHQLPVSTELELLVAKQQALYDSDPESVVDQVLVDKEFHWTLVKATGNTEFSRLYHSLHDRQVRTGIAMFGAAPQRRRSAIAQHAAIAKALTGHDKEKSVELLRDHLIGSIPQVADVFTS